MAQRTKALGRLMASLLVFIPFEGFTPDGSAFGEGLSRAENLLPVHAGHRPLAKAQTGSSIASEEPVTGAMVHIFQAEQLFQEAYPIGDVEGGPTLVRSDGETADMWEVIDEGSSSDNDFMVFGGGGGSSQYIARLKAVVDPTVDTGHLLRFRYKTTGGNGSWGIVVSLGTEDTVLSSFIDTVSGSGDTDEWVERSYPLTTDEASDLAGFYDNLSVWFEVTASGSAQFGRPVADTSLDGWTNQAGSSTNVYQAIDESSASDADYAQSPPLQLQGARRKYRVALSDLVDPFVKDASLGSYTIRYRYRATNTGITARVRLGHGLSTIIKEQTHAAITPGSWIAGSVVINTEAWALPSSAYADMWLELEGHWPSSVVSTVTQTIVATSDIANDFWTPSSGATVWQAIDGDDGVYVTHASEEAIFTVGFPGVDPGLDTAHLLTLKVATNGAGIAAGLVELLEGTTVRYSEDFTTNSAVPANKTFTIHPTFVAQIGNYANLRLRVTGRKPGEHGATIPLQVYYAKLGTPEPRRLRVSWAEFETPSTAQVQLSWARLFVPSVVTDYEGDKPLIYAGTRTKLYHADSTGWTDYSKSGGYAQGTEEPSGWRFAPWGAEILATNYADPVQVLPAGATEFEDAIATPDPAPGARFICPWRERVVLGDISLVGHAADEIWVSAPDDRSDFEPSAVTRAGFQPVRSKPGQLMGLLGGQAAVIAKRNSLHGMYFTGTSVLYRLEDIPIFGQAGGVAYPSSLLGDHTDFFYHSGGHFCRGSAAAGVNAIGGEAVSSFVLDTIQHGPFASRADEDQAMVGARCASTGLILWSLRALGDEPWRHSRAVLYNPVTDQWALHTQPVDVSYVVTNPNSIAEDPHLFRGVLGFTWNGTDIAWYRYSGDTAYGAAFRTKIRELPASPDVVRDPETGRFASQATRPKRVVRNVIPVVSVPGGQATPELTVTVEGFRDMDLGSSNASEVLTAAANRNDRGVYNCGPGVPGFFHRFTVELPEDYVALARLDGLYVLYEIGGEV